MLDFPAGTAADTVWLNEKHFSLLSVSNQQQAFYFENVTRFPLQLMRVDFLPA